MQVITNRETIRRREISYDECKEKSISPVRKHVFIIVDEYWKEFGYRPSLRDIAYQRGKSSLPNTMKIVNRLCELGVLKKQTGRGRTIRPVYINFRTLE